MKMETNEAQNIMNDLLNAFNSTYKAKDEQKIDIAFKRKEYESILNEMWSIYLVNPKQIINYNEQLNIIKKCGCRVLRNGFGDISNRSLIVTV